MPLKKATFRYLGIVVLILLLILNFYLYLFDSKADPEKQTLVSEFSYLKNSFQNETEMMNSYIIRYNEEDLLRIERLDIILGYFDLYEIREPKIRGFESFIESNKEELAVREVNVNFYLEEIKEKDLAIEKNILGFEKDLMNMQESFIINSSQKTIAKRELLIQKVKSLI